MKTRALDKQTTHRVAWCPNCDRFHLTTWLASPKGYDYTVPLGNPCAGGRQWRKLCGSQKVYTPHVKGQRRNLLHSAKEFHLKPHGNKQISQKGVLLLLGQSGPNQGRPLTTLWGNPWIPLHTGFHMKILVQHCLPGSEWCGINQHLPWSPAWTETSSFTAATRACTESPELLSTGCLDWASACPFFLPIADHKIHISWIARPQRSQFTWRVRCVE